MGDYFGAISLFGGLDVRPLAGTIGWGDLRSILMLAVAVVIIYQIAKTNGWRINIGSTQKEQNKSLGEEKVEELIEIMDAYAKTDDHSAEETKTAWEKCNRLLREYGVTRAPEYGISPEDSVLRIHNDVYLHMRNVTNYENKSAFVAKLLDFYYRIAVSYELATTEQMYLVKYLRNCFRWKDNYYSDNVVNNRVIFERNFDWDNWDARCLKLLEYGSKKGSTQAMCYLADCYYNYEMVELRDYDKAFELYWQAAKLGDLQAVYMLGQCYENGRGTKKNYQKAGDCYQFAYNNSNKEQKYAKALDELYAEQKWDKHKYTPDIFASGTTVMKKANAEKLREDVSKCEQTDLTNTESKLMAIHIRVVLEEVVNSFVECYEHASLNDRLDEKITLLSVKGYFTKDISKKAHMVRRLGNRGAHNDSGEPITVEELQAAVNSMKEIVEYYIQY